MRVCARIAVTLTMIMMLAGAISAQSADDQAKTALLIANSDYATFGDLPNPVPEAREFAGALRSIGFDVTILENASREEMLEGLYAFERVVRELGGVALVHYGGHGVQVNGENYLIPANADIPDERRVVTRAVSVREVMSTLDASDSDTNIVILDACRNNPLPETSSRSASRGLGLVEFKPRNSLLVFAAQPGEVADDGLFTPSLAEHITTPGASITEVLQTVRRDVYARSEGEQLPGSYDELLTPVYLAGAAAGGAAASSGGQRPADPAPAVRDDRPTVEVERSTGTLVVSTEVAGTLFMDGVRIAMVGVGEELTLRNVVVGLRELEVRGNEETVAATVAVESDERVAVVLGSGTTRVTGSATAQVRDDAQATVSPPPAKQLPAAGAVAMPGVVSLDLATGVLFYDMDEPYPVLEAGLSFYAGDGFAMGFFLGLPFNGLQATFGNTADSAFGVRAGFSFSDYTPAIGTRVYLSHFAFGLDYALPDYGWPGELHLTVGWNFRF